MPIDAYLLDLLRAATASLPEVTEKRMFGCDVIFGRGRGFALIWKGRLGVKLVDPAAFEKLKATAGTARWTLSKRTAVSPWLLVPESLHDDEEALQAWIRRAHADALAAPKAKPRKPKPRPR
jgi:TfoX/Sxy family transcriptional regulator of competence genes